MSRGPKPPVLKPTAAGLVIAVLTLLAVVAVAVPAQASMTRGFGIRYQINDTGDILLRGNSLVTCPPGAACTNAINRLGSGNAVNNNGYSMQFADIDADPATHSSSSAAVALPSGSSVLFAGLYWSGYTGAGGRTAPPAGTAKNRLLLKAPGDSAYRTVTAGPASPTNPVDGPSTGAPYVSFADVTSIVRSAGSGTYTGADIFAATGPDSYAAWSLVVVVHDPTMPQRNLTVFDGFGTIQNAAGDTTLDIPLNGFTTPPSGSVDVRLGAVVFEGDAGSTGDQFQVIAPSGTVTTLSDPQNPATNVFNSTVSDNGVEVPGRTPDGNTFGFDADVFQSSVLLANSDTSATLRMTTGGETFFPAVATFVSNIFAPRLTVDRTASVTDTVADGRTRPGDRITYTVDVKNIGDDDAEDVRIADAIPAGTTYVPGSLTIDGTPITDTADLDAGELGGSTLDVRLGTAAGASGGNGGKLAPGATTRVRYTVQIASPFVTGGSITGTTQATFTNGGAYPFAPASGSVSTTVDPAGADLAVTHVASPGLVQGGGPNAITWTVTVTNHGPDAEPAPVLVETLPAGVTGVGVTGATCTTAATTLTCSLPALASATSASVTFTGTLPAGSPDPTTATAAVHGDAVDAVPADNSATASVAVNSAPTAAPDSVTLAAPAMSIDVTAAGNDTDPDPADVLAVTGVTAAAHGAVTVVAGKARYTLTDPTFIGTDSFGYTACDGRGGCASSTVAVTVDDHRVADLSVDQTVTPTVVQRGGPLTATWTATVANAGPQAEPAATLSQDLPAGVTGVTVSGVSCTVVLTRWTCPLPALPAGASTVVAFTATLPGSAPDPTSATASVTGTVADPDLANNVAVRSVALNSAPTAVADTAALPASAGSVDVDVTADDSDPDADHPVVTAVGAPGHGTASIVGGKIRYTLTDLTFTGADTFTYTICDGRGACATATVTVAVADHSAPGLPVADLAVTQSATPALLQRSGPRRATWTLTVHNAGPQADTHPVLVQTLPAGASAVGASVPGCAVSDVTVTCALAPLATGGSASVTVTATLAAGTPDPATATATVSGAATDPDAADNTATASLALNTAPVATDARAALPRGARSITVDARAGDGDPDGDPLTLTRVADPRHGSAVLVNGRIRYTLTDPDFAGTDLFTYTVCDDRSGCDTAQVLVTVPAASTVRPPTPTGPSRPVAHPDAAVVRPGATVLVDVLGNDVDGDGELGHVVITHRPATGRASVDPDGRIRYEASDSAVAGSSVTIGYRACDSSGACTEATLELTVAGSAGHLAFTGADLGRPVMIALGLLLGGAILGASSRLRRRREDGAR
jgi:large repetitive protein